MDDSDAELDELYGDDSELEDGELKGDIIGALDRAEDVEYVDAPDDEEAPVGDEDEAGEPGADLQEEEVDPNAVPNERDICEAAADEEQKGDADRASECTRNDHVEIREMKGPYDSRMPDIPTLFELGGMVISRACALDNNAPALVEFDYFDPAKIARAELMSDKPPLRAILRGNTRWKWADFSCFPRGFMDPLETAESLHEIR